MLVPPDGNRSDINEQILEGRHAEEFKRLKATFKRDSSNKK